MNNTTTWEGPSTDLTHGSLRVSDNGRFLVHADGTPFFYLGDTAWELFHRLDADEAGYYLENRRSKGYNVIQAVILAELKGLTEPNAYGHLPLVDNDPTKPNEAYFTHVDRVIDIAESKGLFIGLLPTWADKVGPAAWGVGPEKTINTDNAREYGRFLGKRYGNRPNIIWVLGGDRNPKGYEDVWRELAAGIREGDGGKHPMTYHPMGHTSSGDFLHNEGWLDFNMQQSGHAARNHPNYLKTMRDYNLVPAKPCFDGEPCYENISIGFKPEDGWFDDADTRQAAYWAVFSGAFGHTYGCNDIWQMMGPGREPQIFARNNWNEVLDLPGAGQLIHLRRLMESRPFLSRVPDQSLLVGVVDPGESPIRATRGDGYAMAYTPWGEGFTLDLGPLGAGPFTVSWYNPRNGEWTGIGRAFGGGSYKAVPPGSGRGQDWVLVVDSIARA